MMPIFFILLFTCVACDDSNPHNILLNEFFVRDQPAAGKSHYIEIARYKKDDEISLKGYSIVVATTNKNLSPQLETVLAIDLSDVVLRAGQRYGVIGRSEQEMEDDDIIGWKPSPNLQLVNMQLKSHNWLKVADKKHIIIFLVYSSSTRIFQDPTIWSFVGNKKKMEEPLQQYILTNLVDVFLIRGISTPNTCKGMNVQVKRKFNVAKKTFFQI